MPDEWKIGVIVPIFIRKGDVISCGSYRGVKLLEHAMEIVERTLERQIQTLINLNEMQFGFIFKWNIKRRRMQEDYQKRTRTCICVLLIWKMLLIEFPEK